MVDNPLNAIQPLFFPLPTANDTEFLQKMKEKDWGDGEKEVETIVERTIINNEVNHNVRNNFIYQQGRKVYNSSSTVNFIIVNERRPLPQKPKSRLKIESSSENLDDSETEITIGSPISLQESIEQQQFGQLLWNPVEDRKVKYRQVAEITLDNKVKEFNEKGKEAFIRYLRNYSEDGDEPSFYDSSALFATSSFRGLGGKQGLIFGSDIIRLYASYNTLRSLNIFIGVSDTIPVGYELDHYTPDYEYEKEELNDLELKNNFSEDINEALGIPKEEINWEEWLKEGVSKTFVRRDSTRKKYKANHLFETVQLSLAQFLYRLGLEDYPYEVPESLTLDSNGEDDYKTVKLQNLTDFLEWQVKAFDGVLGQFPIKIEVQDNDLIETGDQSIKIELPNLAETLTEMIGKQIMIEAMVDALLATSLKNIAETGSTRQTAIQNYYVLTSIQEYLGFKIKKKAIDVDFLFNPLVGEEEEENNRLSKALEPKQVKVLIDSNIDENTLEKQLLQLMHAASVIRARYWNSVDIKGNVSQQIKSKIVEAVQKQEKLKEKKSDSLDDFLDNIEDGFADINPRVNRNRPYGRDRDRRPKVRRVKGDE